MNLPKPPPVYDGTEQMQMRHILESEDRRNVKVGAVFDRILMRDTVSGAVVTVTVASGAVVIT